MRLTGQYLWELQFIYFKFNVHTDSVFILIDKLQLFRCFRIAILETTTVSDYINLAVISDQRPIIIKVDLAFGSLQLLISAKILSDYWCSFG